MTNLDHTIIPQQLDALEATLKRLRDELNTALDGVADLRRALHVSRPPTPERTGTAVAPHADDGAGTLNAPPLSGASKRPATVAEFYHTRHKKPPPTTDLFDADGQPSSPASLDRRHRPDGAVPPNDGADNGEYDKQIPPLRSASATDLTDEQSDGQQP